MNTKQLSRIFARSMYAMAILTLVFSVTGSAYAQESTPWLIAFPENDAIEGWEWPEGATVTLTINNAPGQKWSGVAHVTDWGDPRTYVRIEFWEDYDLQISDEVTLKDEFGTTVKHTVQYLTVTNANGETDTVTGTSYEGALVQVWPHGYDQDYTIDIPVGADRIWQADFGTLGFANIEETGGRSWIVIDGSATAVDWNVPESPPAVWRDEFDGPLAEPWYWINENADKWGFTDGFLRIYTSPYGTGGENLLLRPVTEGDFAIETRLFFTPDTNFQFAGLVIWQDENNFLQFGRAFCEYEGAPCVGNGIYFDYTGGGTNFATQIENPFDPAEAYLRLERRGEMVRALYSHEGITWVEIGSHWIPPEFQVNGVGLTSAQDFFTDEWDVPADFDYFELTEGWGFLPEGFHDHDSGIVPSWVCNAGGWAADPDDRAARLNVEIVVDHQTIATPVAGNFRQDLLEAGLCEGGNCGFFTTMWDSISHDEQHTVAVWAQDNSSGEWVLLSNSPKTITCQSTPRVVASITDDWFRVEEFPQSAPLDIAVYASLEAYQGGESPLWTDVTRTTDHRGFAFVGSWETNLDLKPDMYLVVSSGDVSKDIVFENVLLYVFDTAADYLAGSAPPNRHVWVGTGNESYGCNMDVNSDSDGKWDADFASQPCNVLSDMWAAAQVFDGDGDATEANPGFPRGSHDYDTGDVPGWACNAGGWAFDPDDQGRPVPIRVFSDGSEEPVLELVANVDGNRGYEAHIWGLISSYEPLEITVKAYDQESDSWRPLDGTPRPLTCRTYDIYAYDPLTSMTKQITGLEGTDLRDKDEYDPTWSPNGKLVAHDVVTSDSHQIYVTDVKTGISTVLHGTEDGGNDAAWSPNGKWIAFDRRWFGEPNIYIVLATGGDRILTVENAFTASWAPNGKRIAFQSNLDHSIRTAPVDGGRGGETIVADFGETPAWSPDGNWIAYSRYGDIWKVQVNVQGKVLGEPIQLTSNPFNDGKPTWTPDSQTIIYDSNFGQDSDLWSIPAAGGTPTWLTGAVVFGEYGPANARNSTNVAYAGFSPNGQAARTWVAAYTYNAGTWDAGTHTYQFWAGGSPQGDEFSFEVSNDAPLYDGYALIRPGILRAQTPEGCMNIPAINSAQETRFHVGWTFDGTYSDARMYLENLTAQVRWDTTEPADMLMHEIFPLTGSVDWFGYTCTFTTP